MSFIKHYEHVLGVMGELGLRIPDTMVAFDDLYHQTVDDTIHRAASVSGLNRKSRELIALGIAIARGSDSCIEMHTHDAIQSGATQDEIMEAIGVAIMMGGAPAVMEGCDAYEAMAEFQARIRYHLAEIAGKNGHNGNGHNGNGHNGHIQPNPNGHKVLEK